MGRHKQLSYPIRTGPSPGGYGPSEPQDTKQEPPMPTASNTLSRTPSAARPPSRLPRSKTFRPSSPSRRPPTPHARVLTDPGTNASTTKSATPPDIFENPRPAPLPPIPPTIKGRVSNWWRPATTATSRHQSRGTPSFDSPCPDADAAKAASLRMTRMQLEWPHGPPVPRSKTMTGFSSSTADDESLHTASPFSIRQVTTAQPTQFWLGRVSALHDRFRTADLFSKNGRRPHPAELFAVNEAVEAHEANMDFDGKRLHRVLIQLRMSCLTEDAMESFKTFLQSYLWSQEAQAVWGPIKIASSPSGEPSTSGGPSASGGRSRSRGPSTTGGPSSSGGHNSVFTKISQTRLGRLFSEHRKDNVVG